MRKGRVPCQHLVWPLSISCFPGKYMPGCISCGPPCCRMAGGVDFMVMEKKGSRQHDVGGCYSPWRWYNGSRASGDGPEWIGTRSLSAYLFFFLFVCVFGTPRDLRSHVLPAYDRAFFFYFIACASDAILYCAPSLPPMLSATAAGWCRFNVRSYAPRPSPLPSSHSCCGF